MTSELNYWCDKLEDCSNRSRWSSPPGERVDVQVCKCGVPFSCQMYFVYIRLRKTKEPFFCQIRRCIKARGSLCLRLPSRWGKGSRRGLGTWAPSPSSGLRGCARRSQARLLQLPSPTLPSWSLAWATLAGSCAAAATRRGSFNTLGSFYALWQTRQRLQRVSAGSQGGPLCRHRCEQRNSPFLHVGLAWCFCLSWSPVVFWGSKRSRLWNITLNFTF